MNKHRIWNHPVGLLTLSLTLALTACGDDSEDGGAGGTGATGGGGNGAGGDGAQGGEGAQGAEGGMGGTPNGGGGSGGGAGIEVNEEVVPRARLADCMLKAGDRLEIVTLVGGG
jgi:hypothetical protein